MLRFLSTILAGVLVLVILSVAGSVILGQTVLNSTYVQGQVKDANVYARLSGALSKQVTENIGMQDNPQITAAVQQVITPEALQQRIDPAITQLEEYYKGDGPPPRIEVADLIAQAQAAGIPIQNDPELSKPIELAPAQEQKPLTRKFNNVGVISIALAAALMALLIFLSWKTKRYTVLPNVAIVSGVLLGLIALLLLFTQGMIDHFVKFDLNSNAYAGIAHDLAKNISHDLGIRYAVAAACFFAVGVIARIILARITTMPVRPKK